MSAELMWLLGWAFVPPNSCVNLLLVVDLFASFFPLVRGGRQIGLAAIPLAHQAGW